MDVQNSLVSYPISVRLNSLSHSPSPSCTRLAFAAAIRTAGQASVTEQYIVSAVFKKNTLRDCMKTNTFKVCGPWFRPSPNPPS
jgi:hypothetical protein